jgi:hypothetical protein
VAPPVMVQWLEARGGAAAARGWRSRRQAHVEAKAWSPGWHSCHCCGQRSRIPPRSGPEPHACAAVLFMHRLRRRPSAAGAAQHRMAPLSRHTARGPMLIPCAPRV